MQVVGVVGHDDVRADIAAGRAPGELRARCRAARRDPRSSSRGHHASAHLVAPQLEAGRPVPRLRSY
jgi:hypothetical protein